MSNVFVRGIIRHPIHRWASEMVYSGVIHQPQMTSFKTVLATPKATVSPAQTAAGVADLRGWMNYTDRPYCRQMAAHIDKGGGETDGRLNRSCYFDNCEYSISLALHKIPLHLPLSS